MKKGALFRGYAYVTFVEKTSIETALLRDRNHIEGRPAFITKHVDKDSVEKKKGMLSISRHHHHTVVGICELSKKPDGPDHRELYGYINKLGYGHLKIFIVISHQIHYTVIGFSGLMVPRIISNFDRTR